MIEVTAKLIRGPVYLSGEQIECAITFSHPKSAAHKVSQSHNDSFECLAWASAQINCQCTTDNKVKKQVDKGNNLKHSETSLAMCTQDVGHIEIATKPRILFCDLRLSPGQSRTFIYREKIPNDAPPSYRGQLVKYSYKVIVGMQRVNNAIKLLKVPIRVLPVNLYGLGDAACLCNDTSEELSPANPFLEVNEKEKETPFEFALQALQNITARRNPNFYMISNTWGKVARFCLFKPSYKLGEDIIGTFDFTMASVKCVQVSVSLQCEEETTIKEAAEKNNQIQIVTFSKHHEVCLGLQYTQLILPIPLHVTPAFTTQLVSLKWRLHFEFVTSTSKELNGPAVDDLEWRAPIDLPIETMVWSLPIKLFSTSPVQVAQGLQANTCYKLVI
ncbi:PREDICTED: RAB6A-GEF complex partner protein 2 [Nicrophorus vespilloides]|uniref:RAB6A-GEF complex partner protein 2 n=1 Tax=Nicrophorus vespilloides TaxID=110193 RepID=A0ABM1MAM5_NICVS|nr:PREDICTED: RAB6A-GEF complex partner protein 2 [Nicrophorus vespilloides]